MNKVQELIDKINSVDEAKTITDDDLYDTNDNFRWNFVKKGMIIKDFGRINFDTGKEEKIKVRIDDIDLQGGQLTLVNVKNKDDIIPFIP